MLNDDPGDERRQGVDAHNAGRHSDASDRHRRRAKFQQAVDAGATVIMPLTDQFWGDRFTAYCAIRSASLVVGSAGPAGELRRRSEAMRGM